MAGSKNGRRNKGRHGKGAGAKAEAEKVATPAAKQGAKGQAKSVAKAAPQAAAAKAEVKEVKEVKAGSKNKNVNEKKKGRGGNVPKAEEQAPKKNQPSAAPEPKAECKDKSVRCKAECKEKPSNDTWFLGGEEASADSWFWKGEEAYRRPSAKHEGKAKHTGAKKSEPLGATGYKSKAGGDDDEEDNVIGSWFWEGDETSFDPNPKPVSRIVRPLAIDEINEKNRPKDWSEVTIWPKAPAVTPAVLGYRSQDQSEARPPSYIVLGSREENAQSAPAGATAAAEADSCPKNISAFADSVLEYPFDSEPCTQTIEEIRRQIKIREMNGIKPFSCPCKIECYMDSEEFERLISLLKSTTDPLIHKIAQIAMGIIDVHPYAQEFINDVGVVTLIESLLTFPNSDIRKKAVITLNTPSEDERQRRIEIHVKHMCKETIAFPLNSPGQQSGLKVLAQLTTNVNNHYIAANYFTEFFNLLSTGNRKTRNLVLKVLLNLSENPAAARDMIDTKALAALKLIFNQKEAKANLVSAVAIFINIKEHLRKGSLMVMDHQSYNTLMAIFREVKVIIETM